MSLNDFNSDFLTPLLEKVSLENKTLILLGDFNVNLLKVTSIPSVTNFFDIISSFSLLPHIILPTRITSFSQTIIDNIFGSSSETNTISGNITTSISDHFAQFLVLNQSDRHVNNSTINYSRDWRNFDKCVFRNDLRKVNWNDVLKLPNQNVDTTFDNFFKVIENLLDFHAPIKQSSSKKHNEKFNSPWMTCGIVHSIEVRNRLYRSFLHCKNPTQKAVHRENYKRYRNRIVSLCRQSNRNFYRRYFKDNLDNISNVWKGVRSIISLKHNDKFVPTSLNINGSVSSNPGQISNEFNNFFSSIADKIRSKIPFANKHFSSFLGNPIPSSIFLNPVSSQEVADCIET